MYIVKQKIYLYLFGAILFYLIYGSFWSDVFIKTNKNIKYTKIGCECNQINKSLSNNKMVDFLKAIIIFPKLAIILRVILVSYPDNMHN